MDKNISHPDENPEIEISPGEEKRRDRIDIPRWFYAFVPNRAAGGLTGTLMPLFITQVLNGNMSSIGWLSSVTSLASVPASVVWGNLSDRTQRRRPYIFIGLAGFALFTILIGLGNSLVAVAVLSSLSSLLGTATGPASSALTMESVSEKELPEAFGWFNQIGGVAYVAGMLIGMAWLEYLPRIFGDEMVMRALMIFSGSLALLSPILTLLWIKEPRRKLGKRRFLPQFVGRMNVGLLERAPKITFFFPKAESMRGLGRLLSSDLGKYYLYSLLMFLGVNMAFMPLPVYLHEVIGATNGQVFLISLVKSLFDTFFFVPMGRLLMHRRGIGLQAQAAFVRLFLFGLLALLAYLQLRPLIGIAIIVVIQILNGVTWAAISVSGPTAVAVLSPKGQEARSMGTYTAVLGVAGIIGGPITGIIVDSFGYVVSYGLAAVIMALTAFLMWNLKADALRDAPPLPTKELIFRKRKESESQSD